MKKKKSTLRTNSKKLSAIWQKLSDQDRLNIKSHRQELIDKLQAHCGKTKQEAEDQIDDLISSNTHFQ
tara:strand:+ start:197 stop:400 length:204 start_codon:yes stop_codon:yes gene_type:complete